MVTLSATPLDDEASATTWAMVEGLLHAWAPETQHGGGGRLASVAAGLSAPGGPEAGHRRRRTKVRSGRRDPEKCARARSCSAGRSDREAATMQEGKEEAEQKRASPRLASGTQSRALRRPTGPSDEGHDDAVRPLRRSRARAHLRAHLGRPGQGQGLGQEARAPKEGAREVTAGRDGGRDPEATRPRRLQERRGQGHRSLSTYLLHRRQVERHHDLRTDENIAA